MGAVIPMSEEIKPDITRPARPRPPSGGRRRHRGGRGRGRGRPTLLQPTAPPAEIGGVAQESSPAAEPGGVPAVQAMPRLEPQGTAISQALAEVMSVVEALKHATEAIEEALELVELAERQKIADEREIDSLRRALRQLQRPRGGVLTDEEARHP